MCRGAAASITARPKQKVLRQRIVEILGDLAEEPLDSVLSLELLERLQVKPPFGRCGTSSATGLPLRVIITSPFLGKAGDFGQPVLRFLDRERLHPPIIATGSYFGNIRLNQGTSTVAPVVAGPPARDAPRRRLERKFLVDRDLDVAVLTTSINSAAIFSRSSRFAA